MPRCLPRREKIRKLQARIIVFNFLLSYLDGRLVDYLVNPLII